MKPSEFLKNMREIKKERIAPPVSKERFKELDSLFISREEVLKMIDDIDLQIPDDDGIPYNLTVEEFKKEIKSKISEVGKSLS